MANKTKPNSVHIAAQAVADEYEADVYLYSGAIDQKGFGAIVGEVAEHKSRDRALLIIVTDGGLANSGYQIARLFQKVYDGKLTIYCPSRCKSAGTLVALGADRLIMDQFSELGPLDVQMVKQNEIMSRKSGLLARSSFDALADSAFELYERLMIGITVRSEGNVSFQLASEVSSQMAARMMAGVYDQINPDVVGSEKRDLEIAREYGERLVAHSGNANSAAVYHLVYNYPSHDFIIDDEEAMSLFNNVEYPKETLYDLVGILGEGAYEESSPVIACALTRPAKEKVANDVDNGTSEDEDSDGAEVSLDGGRHADREGNPEEGEPDHERSAPDAQDEKSDMRELRRPKEVKN